MKDIEKYFLNFYCNDAMFNDMIHSIFLINIPCLTLYMFVV